MTLAAFALLVDAAPKWILNASAVLHDAFRYSIPHAQRLAAARALQEGASMPLPRAWSLAGEAIPQYTRDRAPVTLTADPDATVSVTLDVHRILAAVSARLSRLRTMHSPRRRGRRSRAHRNPLRAAVEYGVDLSLLEANLRRTPAERLRQLDAMVAFSRSVRRTAAT